MADAAMLSEERLEELKENKIFYIVGARLANANLDLVKQIRNKLSELTAMRQDKDGAIVRPDL